MEDVSSNVSKEAPETGAEKDSDKGSPEVDGNSAIASNHDGESQNSVTPEEGKQNSGEKKWVHPEWDGFGSEGWKKHAGGIFHDFSKTSHIMVASVCCPCLVAALNAYEVSWGSSPPDDSHDPKWGLGVAALYLANPCSVGSAVREEIWKLVTQVHEQDASRIKNNKSKLQQMRFFCLPHCCCTMCCAVAQDRRVGLFQTFFLQWTLTFISIHS